MLHNLHVMLTLFRDGVSLSRLSLDNKKSELLILRQQMLLLRRHQKCRSSIASVEKLILLTLVDQPVSVLNLTWEESDFQNRL